MPYLYKATVYKSTSSVAGLTQAQMDQHATDKSNFETNYKASSMVIDEVIIAETTYSIILTYTNFKAKIVTPLAWTDVRYIDSSEKYTLNLISSIAL